MVGGSGALRWKGSESILDSPCSLLRRDLALPLRASILKIGLLLVIQLTPTGRYTQASEHGACCWSRTDDAASTSGISCAAPPSIREAISRGGTMCRIQLGRSAQPVTSGRTGRVFRTSIPSSNAGAPHVSREVLPPHPGFSPQGSGPSATRRSLSPLDRCRYGLPDPEELATVTVRFCAC